MTRRRALIVAALAAAWAAGFALLDRDLRIDDDPLHEWRCPRCDFGCGARGATGVAWVERTARRHLATH